MALQPTPKAGSITKADQTHQVGSPYITIPANTIKNFYIPEAYSLRTKLQTPPSHQYSTRIQSNPEIETPTKNEGLNNLNVKPQKLNLHPETPKAEDYAPPVKQAASTTSVLATIANGLKGKPGYENLVKAIKDYAQEQKALGGVAV
jgi:hypothetical protein